MTGHRTLAMLGRYSDHLQTETVKKSREILDTLKRNESNEGE